MMTRVRGAALAVALACWMSMGGLAAARSPGELVIGLQEDPDTLDPDLSWSFVGRHVLQSLCDKLVDIDTQGNFVPMLATSWAFSDGGKTLTLRLRQGVRFHDGTAFDADAVKFNLERSRTLKGSRRIGEIEAVEAVGVIDPATVRITLKRPSAPFLAILADRAGMMESPAAVTATGEAFHKAPVCSGPYRFVEHKAQERIVLARFADHWRAREYHFERVVFRAFTDSNARLLNLRSDQLQLVERLAPTDVAELARDTKLAVHNVSGTGYTGITFNIANGEPKSQDQTRLKALRQAFDLAIDREAINKVVFDGRYETGNQPFPPSSPYYDATRPVRGRDVAAARTRLAAAGLKDPTMELLVPTDPARQQAAELLQSMAADAGIKLVVQRVELMTMLARAKEGKFQASFIGWSGRSDPDLNISLLLSCTAGGNDGRYCNPVLDAALAEGRSESDPAKRKQTYSKAIGYLLDDLPIAYLFHQRWLFGTRSDLAGFKGAPDGIIRLEGVRLAN